MDDELPVLGVDAADGDPEFPNVLTIQNGQVFTWCITASDPVKFEFPLPDADFLGETVGADRRRSHHLLNHLRLECFAVLSHFAVVSRPPAGKARDQNFPDQTG
jgi:hypothetical protein